MRIGAGLVGCAAALVVWCAVAGCAAEERVVAVRGGLQNVPGAQGGIRAERPAGAGGGAGGERVSPTEAWDRMLTSFYGEPDWPEPDADPHPLRVAPENDPEDVTLVLRAPVHLLVHLRETLEREEADLIFEQVMSDRLKRNYREALKEPREGLVWIARNRRDILELLASLPNAELTAGAFLRPLGDRAYRLIAPGAGGLSGGGGGAGVMGGGGAGEGRRFDFVDMVIEDGSFRLLLIGSSRG
mgnify:CR=1 FL=1